MAQSRISGLTGWCCEATLTGVEPDHARQLSPMWVCPRCGQQYAARNLWHSCATVPVATHLAGKPRAAALFAAFQAAVEEHGPVTVVSTKSRFGFMRRVRFAGVIRAKPDSLRIGFWLKRPVESPRFVRVQHLGHDDWIYELELRDEAELDAELRRWLGEAFLVGDQVHLRRRSERTGGRPLPDRRRPESG